MKAIKFIGVVLSLVASLSSCSNDASDPDNSAQDVYANQSVTGDTITQHASDFSTALHHVTNDINQVPLTGNAERDFAVLLKAHHQGVIDIAQAEIKNGKDDALKQMAAKISETYQREITELEAFVGGLKNGPVKVASGKGDKVGGFNNIIKKYKSMLWEMSKMDTTMVADKQFVAVMIPHIQSSVFLAEGYLDYGKDAKLQGMAQDIIPRKNKQIEELNRWMDRYKNTAIFE